MQKNTIKYLEGFIEFCDCGNPKADCICIDKNGWKQSKEYILQSKLDKAIECIKKLDDIDWSYCSVHCETRGAREAIESTLKELEGEK